MRIVEKLAIPVFLIAGGMAYLADELDMPFLLPAAFSIFGLFAIALGVGTLIEGRIQMFDRVYSRRENYSGLSARLLGVIIFLFGACLILYSAGEWLAPGKVGEFLVGLVETSRGRGILLITFGFFTLLFGIIRLVSGSAHSPKQRSVLVDLGFRFFGLAGTLVGIVLLSAGLWLVFK